MFLAPLPANRALGAVLSSLEVDVRLKNSSAH